MSIIVNVAVTLYSRHTLCSYISQPALKKIAFVPHMCSVMMWAWNEHEILVHATFYTTIRTLKRCTGEGGAV